MITSLKVENWKSFGEGEIYFDPLTILVGANDSGKSNFLEVLWFLSQLAEARSIDSIFNGVAAEQFFRGDSRNVIREGEDRATVRVEIDSTQLEVSTRMRYSISIKYADGVLRVDEESLVYLYPEDNSELKPVFETIKDRPDGPRHRISVQTDNKNGLANLSLDRTRPAAVQVLNLGTEYVVTPIQILLYTISHITVFDPQPIRMRNYSKRSHILHTDGSNLAGYMAEIDEPQKSGMNKAISEQLNLLVESGLSSVYAQLIPPVNTDAQLLAKQTGRKLMHPIDGRLLSDGTLRYVAIIVALATAPSGSLLVLEEVDDGLHPAKAALLASFLRETALSRNVDLLITTHNSTLLNAFGPDIVPFTYYAHRETLDRSSTITRIYDIDRLPKILGLGGVGSALATGRMSELIDQ